ncbi:unnamed protein product [Paramecium sonneborni]|uniref:Uncharacterized protein n=1 Tax=Paramecium sonneborni TaxID=65129 RepID=A0A8S1M7B2_9CILI|nr:unnamed protein product [Paramecium sonneborni]
MSSNRLKEMRENFHLEIRKLSLESQFRLKRLIITPMQQKPIEKLNNIVEKITRSQIFQNEEYQTMNQLLDEIEEIVINDTSSIIKWTEYITIIKSLVDQMQKGYLNPEQTNIAIKAASCFRNLLKAQKPTIQMQEQINQAFEIYKSWIESDSCLLSQAGLKGMNQLAYFQHPKLNQYDQVQSILMTLQINPYNEQALKLLSIITKNVDDDNQVIAILRQASRLIETCDSNLREKGLKIFENASRNIQNIQFILSMKAIDSILDFVYFKEKNISKISMTILVNLSYTSDVEDCQKLLDLGITDVIYKLLKNSIFTYSRIFGSMIFNNLMASSHLILDKVIQNLRLLELVLDLLETDVVDVRRELFQAFRNFLVVCTQQQLLNMIDNGMIDYLILGLDDIDTNIIQLAIETLYLTMKNFVSTDYQLDIYYKFSIKNVAKKLDKLQYSENEQIYQMVSRFIQEFYDQEFDDSDC